jgi:hypothetical protein
MVAATIERLGDHLVYSFELEYAGHHRTEQVQIDAVTYCVELDAAGNIVMRANPELIALPGSALSQLVTAL